MDAATLRAYDSGAVAFAQDWHDQPPPTDLRDLVRQFFRPGVTADIGCGSGRDVAWLAANGFPALGYDASAGLLAQARARYPDLVFHAAALPALEGIADMSFANVLCETVIMHLPREDVAPAVRRLLAILAPGGALYLSWRVTREADQRDEHGRLYGAFDAGLVRRALGHADVLLDEEALSASSGKTIHRLVARKAPSRASLRGRWARRPAPSHSGARACLRANPESSLPRGGGVRSFAAPQNDGEVLRSARTGAGVNILSIQSHVAYGHVGNSAAVFALQRLGCEVWPVHTVQFSNHTGYGGWKGEAFSAATIDAVVAGIAERGVLASCDGVLSGYVGSVDVGAAVLRAAERVKAANPGVVYCCDPVIGNRRRGVFVRQGVTEFFRERAIPLARIITPNHFEVDRLVGDDTADMAQLASAIGLLHVRGPGVVLVTSVEVNETPAGHIDVVASDGAGLHLVRTPRLAAPGNGAGDLIAALFLYHCLRGDAAAEALARATSSVFGLLRRSLGAAEIALVAAQDELVAPSEMFVPQRIGG